MRNYLCNIKEQIASLTNVQTLTGQIDNNGDNFEVYSKIPHKQAVYTWALNLQRPNTSNLKTQMYYYNSLTKQKKNSKAIPDEGLYINNGNDSSFVEMRTFV